MEALKGITDLSLRFRYIARIENLHFLANLTSLDLSSNNIRRIEGLKLPKLQHLKLYGCEISKIEGLEDVPNLQTLHLE